MKTVGFAWALFTFVISAPCLAGDGLSREYKACVKAAAKGEPLFGRFRYGGDEFGKAVNECGKLVEKDVVRSAFFVESYRDITKLYVSTLSFMNKKIHRKKVKEKEAFIDPSIQMIGLPKENESTELKLDGFSQNDLSILYVPWVRCVAKISSDYVAKNPESKDNSQLALQEASRACLPVSQIADPEARRVILQHTKYKDSASQSALIDEHKMLGMQMALIGLLRHQGASLGEALKKSFEANGDAIGGAEASVDDDTKAKSNAPNQ